MKKGMTRRRLLALVLCLAMLFSCVPQGAIPVFAAGDDTASQGQPDTGETPTEPEVTTEPTEPEDTTAPTEPEVTTEPTEPEDTTAPTEPEVTTEPTQPGDITAPTEPEVTTETTEPQNPAEPAQPQNPAVPLAGTEVASDSLTDTITYTITAEVNPDGTPYHVLTLEGTGAMPDYNSFTYTRAPWYTYRDTLRQVILDKGITSVGDYAFYQVYPKLTTLQFPSTLATIGRSAFYGCGLTGSLDFSDCQALTTIGDSAFRDCTGLTGSLDFSDCQALTTIGDSAFSGCTGLTGSLDFSGCPELTTIGNYAFWRCTGLTTLNLSSPELTTIGDGAFRDCTGLTGALDLSGCPKLTTIGSSAFSGCRGLTTLNLSSPALTTIGSTAFQSCTGLTTLDLSCPKLTTIGDYAFQSCTGLTTLNLSCPTLTTIGDYAFYNCSGLTGSLDFSGCPALTTIGNYAFQSCTGLTTLNLSSPELTTISSSAFSGCTGLTGSLDFSGCPALTTISSSAFSGCTGLTGSLDFSGCPALTTIGNYAFFRCTGLTGSLDFSGCPELTTIGYSAFQNCTGLTGSLDFSGCPALTTIGNYAFFRCTGLTTLNLSCPNLTTVAERAFGSCTKLNTITVEDGNKLTQVGASAFESTAVTTLSLVLPDQASADGMALLLAALPERPQWLTLAGDSTQSMCFSQDFLKEVKDTRYRIAFAPGFLTFSPGDFGDITGAAPLNTLKGLAWVDNQGAVYLLNEDGKTASLAYIPSDLKSYTVPETVGEGERIYDLISVSSNVLARAYQLEEITFADSKAVALADFALAGCPTLTSVNKETTVEGAKNLFKSVGKSAFLNTGLQEAALGTEVSLGTPINVSTGADASFTLSSLANQPLKDGVTGTGNPVTITARISGAQIDDYWYRIYFLVSHGQFDLSGLQLNVGKEYVDDNGVRYILHRHPELPGLYYVDIQVPIGATCNRQFILNYPPLTPGGRVLVWAESGSGTTPSPDIQTQPDGEYYQAVWETEPVPYTLSDINRTSSYSYTRPGVGALVTLSPDLSWRINLTGAQRTEYGAYTSLAQDPARQAVHTMTFTLPEGLSWNPVLTGDVQPLTLSGDYWCLEGTPILRTSPDSNTSVQKVTAVIADGKLVLTLWKAAKGQALPTNSYLGLTLAQSVVQVPDEKGFHFNDSYEISLQVDTKLVYTFDQPASLAGSALWKSTPPKVNLTYEKTSKEPYIYYTGNAYYRLKAANDTIFNHTLTKISDPLPTDLFITPQGIRELFTLSTDDWDNQNLAQYLTLTISHARRYIYDGNNALGNVTLSDGETQYLLTAEMTDEYNVPCEEDVTVTITLGNNPGTLKVAFGKGTPEEVPMDELDHYLKTRGLALLRDTQYTVTWNFGAEHEILSGDTYLLQIPVEPKDSFQLLATDCPIYRGATTSSSPDSYDDYFIGITNKAEFEDPTLTQKSYSSYYYRDYAIGKSASTTSVQNGGIVDYSIRVYQYSGSPREAGLPVVDAVSGTQCLLAPVSENEGQSWAKDAEIYPASDGTQYYLLKLPDSARVDGRYTYGGVWLNGYYADSVTVIDLNRLEDAEKAKYNHSEDYTDMGSALASDGYLTEIRWYLTSTTYTPRTLKYSVLVDVAYSTQENPLSGTLCNIAYLNDRDNHRLFDSTGTIPIHTMGGDKELLDESGQVLGNNSPISAGETVHYRLTVNNLISRNMTIGAENVADVLPHTYGVFAWSEANVKLRYELKSVGTTESFPWKIQYNTEDGTYVIRWPEGLEVPANDTLYIYVDLTFPADASGEDSPWKSYCEQVGSDTLVNTFRLINMTYSVTHNLNLPGSAYIQKGVVSSQYYYSSSKVGENMDLRYYSEQSSGNMFRMRETFYILLYNAGSGPLYLTQLEDHFPAGAVASVDTVKLITERTSFSSLPQDLVLVQASIGSRKSDASIAFTFTPASSEDGMPTITYDAAAEAYYLQPNQAIAFSCQCILKTDLAYWENTVAMPLYDPNSAGVGVARIPQVHNAYEMEGKTGNDGFCTFWTAEEGSALGYNSQRADEGWVASSVPLRKETVAGLEKQVVQRRSTYDVISPYNGYALPLDSLQWELTVYNDGSNIIDGFTITDTFPDNYTLAEGEVAISGVDYPSLNTQTLFEVAGVKTGADGLVESVTLSDGTVISVEGEKVSTKEYDISLYYNEDEQLVMELTLHLSDDDGVIFPGKNVKLTYWSKNYTNFSAYTTYVNSAVLTTKQELNYDKVSHGRVEWDENGEPAGILARAIAVISGGYSTGSEKTVTEVGDSDNTASSNQIGSITLSQTADGYSHFTYELLVNNSAAGTRGMDWITLIDNLPQLDDTMTLNQKIQRGSEFQVEFAKNPQVKVWYVTEDNQRVDISNAVIRYSDKVTFGTDDWGAENTPPTGDGWRETSAGARSIRIYISSDGDTPVVPAGATLHVSFECQVKMDASVAPGRTAWNSFGYRYLMSGDILPLEAAPLEVGVRIPDYPRIQKVLTDETGEAIAAQEDTEFYFLVYKGDKISGDFATGAALLQALESADRNFTIAKVTVPKGASQAELKLENQKICTYTPESGWTETNNPWVWTDGGSYTVVELGDELTVGLGSYQDYEFASLDYVPDNSYTFQYNKSTSQLIRGENTLALRKLQIQKVDQVDQSHKLPGAVFGLYSPNPGDQLTGDALQTAATALELTDEQIQELNQKTVITVNETFYYLYRLGKTDDKGLITWENLPGMSYCYVELWAPEGYYITQKEPVVVSFQEGDAYLRSVTHTVTNKQIVYLPKTGGMGRWQIPALGLILCAAVVTVFLGKRRKKAA